MAVVEVVCTGIVPALDAQAVQRVGRVLHFPDQSAGDQPALEECREENVEIADGGHQAAGRVTRMQCGVTDVQALAEAGDVAMDQRGRGRAGACHRGGSQAQRLNDVRPQHLADRTSAQPFHDHAKHDVVRIGVLKTLCQPGLPRLGRCQGKEFAVAPRGGQYVAEAALLKERGDVVRHP
ncbi:hypothetical protein D9M72_559350 [compost metagenome]